MNKSGVNSPAGSPRHLNAGRKLPTPPHGGTPRATTTHNATGDDVAPELQADSSNLSYSPRDESDRSYGASSCLSIRLEECSVELAETLTIDDPLPRARATSPESENDNLDLLEFLAELTPQASPTLKVTSLFLTVPEVPPEVPQTRQSHARNRFASQKTQKSSGLTTPRLRVKKIETTETAEETTTTLSQDSPGSPSTSQFVPHSPRASTTRSSQRLGYLQHTPRSPVGRESHSRSGSLEEISTDLTVQKQERKVRDSRRRVLDKVPTRHVLPGSPKQKPAASTTRQSMSPVVEEPPVTDDWARFGQLLEPLVDEAIALAGRQAAWSEASVAEEPTNPEKPPVEN
jgi:hypothetical protein